MSHRKQLDHMRIPLDHIISATDNFSEDNFLGMGGFGRVYKGQLPPDRESGQPGGTSTMVAVKRLDVKLSGQGDREFSKEIVMLANYKHTNLVSLIGFVDEGGEKILVYKNEDNGSLDRHVGSTNLVWEQRLRICIGAAHGIEYLHDGVGPGHRVIHRDIKSSNILIDANWEAKISDFGLSVIGPKDQSYTFLVTSACGTLGYVDPVYAKTLELTKESDVYSFGVVLFEVLCGRLAAIKTCEDKYMLLSRMVNENYEHGDQLKEIIFQGLDEQMDPESLEKFSKVAFRCLNERRESRPTMRTVVEELESALEHQLGKPITEPERQTISLDDEEEIIGLSGSVGVHHRYELVTSLCVMTNKRKYGPFNREVDNRFSGSWDAGLFDGFYGRVGTYIDAIGCCLKATTTF